MKKYYLISITVLFLIVHLNVKGQNILPRLQELFGAKNVIPKDSSAFDQYYIIDVPQAIDHNDSTKGSFLNRVLLGFNNVTTPIVMESAAYGITGTYRNIRYKTELTELLNTNQLIVEHRYFGTSIPDSTTFKYLTYKQVSDDFHHIRQKLNAIFPSKWITTGWSKGGDEVFAYKYYYPDDVGATVAYGISLTMEKEDKRFEKFIAQKRKTTDGKKLYEDQVYLLKNKKRLLPAFIDFMQSMEKFTGADYGTYDAEIMYDYNVLDLGYTFWQWYGDNGKFGEGVENNYEALIGYGYKPKIPKDDLKDKIIYLFEGMSDKRMKAHFYQSFSQGGYYGYDEKPFSKYLKQKDYPLDVFAGEKTVFDNSFRLAQKKFAETNMERVMFILADTDPWSIICPIPMAPGKDNVKLVLKDSNHSVKLKDFDEETRNLAVQKLKLWIGEK
ncbi:MAG: S28 family serine protease [Ferruginibacter sp.]